MSNIINPYRFAAAAPSGDYITATGGTIYTEDTDYKVHVFIDSSEDFVITDVSGEARIFDVFMLGGGGGCGSNYVGYSGTGGGGAGGLVEEYSIAAEVETWEVGIGGGGPSQSGSGTYAGTQGSLTSFNIDGSTDIDNALGGGKTENSGGGAGSDGGCGGGGAGTHQSGGAGSAQGGGGGSGGAGGGSTQWGGGGGGGGVGFEGGSTSTDGSDGTWTSGTSSSSRGNGGDGGGGIDASSAPWINATNAAAVPQDSPLADGVGEVDGSNVYFGGGGRGGGTQSPGVNGTNGSGASGYNNTGGGGTAYNSHAAHVDGADGIIIVRYQFQN